jgi:hypothetical protein
MKKSIARLVSIFGIAVALASLSAPLAFAEADRCFNCRCSGSRCICIEVRCN